jgi:hypothetical protein
MSFRSVARTALPRPVHGIAAHTYSALRRRYRALSRRAQTQYLGGSAVICPYCDARYRRFLPTGILEREFFKTPEAGRVRQLAHVTICNQQCPRCGSSERHRLAYFYLKERRHLDSLSGVRILDVAPDDYVTEALFNRSDLDYVSIDLNRENAQFNMDITNLGFEDDEFDVIICYHTLEHVKDDGRAMRELLRVMKPGGWAIIQVPLWADDTVEDPETPRSDYLRLHGHSDHVRRYGKDFKDRLENAGFKVTLDGWVRELPDEKVRKYGLMRNEDIYLCEKV